MVFVFSGIVNINITSITIDIVNRKIDLVISKKEIENRFKTFKPIKPKIKKGWLSRYAKLVTSASTGAVMKA